MAEDVARLREWVDRLDAFSGALEDLEGESPIDFCESACDAWKNIAMTDSPPQASAAVLVVTESFAALTTVMTEVSADWADTPDVRDRLTRSDVEQLLRNRLASVLGEARQWLAEGLPSADEIAARNASVRAVVNESLQYHASRKAEMDAEDVEAEADPYGAVLLYSAPAISDAPIFTKLCSFTEGEHRHYLDAHERIQRMIDSELLQHISDESDRLLDVLIAVIRELQGQSVSLGDQDAMDERRRRIRSALISFTAALQIHEYQTIRSVRQRHGLGREQVAEVKALFDDLKTTSFAYRWLEALRDALQHGDINAFKWSFHVSIDAEPEVTVNLDRGFMLEFIGRENRNKPWLKLRELQELDDDPSVLDMIQAVQPLMAPLQKKLDKVLYPNVANDAATVRELIARFEGRQGMYFLQNGPGFTRRRLAPQTMPLAPRVLHFAETYEP
ncbi:hypothetical protein [Mycobacteroides abscessus]|uniref:hypothetical protein n=1 Tax=Mycobacteroides abscessus TaxID=36809 RepID=UPI0005E22526|nr:hypothetical protein [Mycobacteroides abscessus]CPS19921.1 Uncharacterised protein [Mycobacteroides abscessus]CPS46681.1 Uncharacterised protein [Mycobacteroides abscessus]CPS49073.1 Uncharacterised protein [Mycobacteroides abscessus]CPT42040.1 Uncharacterised protein [Mycobacteroides abscessus]CPT42628.1 Uncharacterised protein [Mycobacteroides abscessus]